MLETFNMAYVSKISADISAIGDDSTIQKLEQLSTIINSASVFTCSYVLAPGQEQDLLVGILPPSGFVGAKFYAVKGNFPFNLASSIEVGPLTYTTPPAQLFFNVGGSLPTQLSQLKVRALPTATASTNITVTIGFG